MTGYLMFAAIICGVTALIDMGMNGSGYADWAPWGLGLAFGLGVLANLLAP